MAERTTEKTWFCIECGGIITSTRRKLPDQCVHCGATDPLDRE